MKLVIADIEFTIDDGHLQLASVSHGENEYDPLFERSFLFATKAGDFYLLGGGGNLTLWRRPVDGVWDFDCGRIPMTRREALAWAGRFAPAAVFWINIVIRDSELVGV